MLGELIAQGGGKRNVRRVLSTEPIEVEVTFEAAGKVLGVDYMEIGTYTSEIRSDGTIYGEGHGVLMTAEGGITWKGAGVGVFKERGAVSYRGAIYFHTAVAKFAQLNTVAGVFEFEVDENGNTQTKVWEWK
ncbi:MAG: hypothetical protein ABSB15_19320 [Bryobacteraceae bacterium]|jgi:hypothetical protein